MVSLQLGQLDKPWQKILARETPGAHFVQEGPGLVSFLAERFDADVEVANPLKRISYDESVFEEGPVEEIAPMLTVGIGLALRDG